MMRRAAAALTLGLSLAAVPAAAHADTTGTCDPGLVNHLGLETLHGPSYFPPGPPKDATITKVGNGQTLTITFSGGYVITAPAGLKDHTTTYGTEYDYGPLTVTFSQPVTNLHMWVLNGANGVGYLTLTDDTTASHSYWLTSYRHKGSSVMGQAGPGQVSVATLSAKWIPWSPWDFFLDDLSWQSVC